MNNTQTRRVDDSHNPEPDLIPTSPVIDGGEKLDDWLEHREIVVQELCPLGALETMYAQRAALYLWRLKRVIGFENDASLGGIEIGSENSCEMSQVVSKTKDSPDRSKLQTIIKYEAHLVRCLSSTMAELRRLQKERRQGLRDAVPGGRGAGRAGDCQNDLDEKGSHDGSPSRQITGAEISIPGGRGADRAGVFPNDLDKKGSHDGSPSRQITSAEILIPGGRGADRAGVFPNDLDKKGSHGGSPSRKSSTSQKSSTAKKNSTTRSLSHTQRASPIPKPPPLLESITNRRRLEEYTRGEIFERNLASATLDFAMIPCP